jgi:hypothetical protein
MTNRQRPRMKRGLSKSVLATLVSLLIVFSIGAVLLSYESSTKSVTVPSPTGPTKWASLRGVNYFWTTVVDPSRPMMVAPPPWVSFPQMRENGWNLIRVTMHWNEYAVDPSQYIGNMRTIAQYAEQNGLEIIWDLIHQAGTSSQYIVDGEQGVGFPTFLTEPYQTPRAFWNAWWANKTSYNGVGGWYLALQYEIQIVKAVNNYTSTLGYEIMNEPPLFSLNTTAGAPTFNFSGMLKFNSYMATNLRQITSDTIVYDRPYLHPDVLTSCVSNIPSCLLEVTPTGVSNVVLDYHQYDTLNVTLLSEIQAFSKQHSIPVFLGEFAPCSRTNTTCPTSQSAVEQYIYAVVSQAHSYGWAWTYWAWRIGSPGPPWQDLLNSTGQQWWLDSVLVSVQTEVY